MTRKIACAVATGAVRSVCHASTRTFVTRLPCRVTNARALRIKGQGAATMLVTPGAAFIVDTGIALAIEDLAILSLGRASAIRIRTVIGLSLQRLIVFVLGSRDATGAGISLGLSGSAVSTNYANAPVGNYGDQQTLTISY